MGVMDSLGAMIDSAVCQGREVDPYLPVWHICYIARNALAVLVITSLDLFNCNFFRYYFSKKKSIQVMVGPGHRDRLCLDSGSKGRTSSSGMA